MRKLSAAVCLIMVFCASPSFSDHSVVFGYDVSEPGEELAYDLAQTAQNPVAHVIILLLQNNTHFNFSPQEKTQNILNIQPVIQFGVDINGMSFCSCISDK